MLAEFLVRLDSNDGDVEYDLTADAAYLADYIAAAAEALGYKPLNNTKIQHRLGPQEKDSFDKKATVSAAAA